MNTIHTLYDCKKNEILVNDIVKSVIKVEFGEKVTYYLYDLTDSGSAYLLRLDKKEEVANDQLGHIKIDAGISLLNSENAKWYRIGTRNEVSNDIYSK